MDALVCVECLQDYISLRLSQWRSRAKAPCRTLSVPSDFHSYACPQALPSGTAPARQDLVRQVCLAVLQKACTSTAKHMHSNFQLTPQSQTRIQEPVSVHAAAQHAFTKSGDPEDRPYSCAFTLVACVRHSAATRRPRTSGIVGGPPFQMYSACSKADPGEHVCLLLSCKGSSS